MDPFGQVFIERVELPALRYVGRARLLQLVERTPKLGSIAEVGHGREVDPRLLASSLIGNELGVVELGQVEFWSRSQTRPGKTPPQQ